MFFVIRGAEVQQIYATIQDAEKHIENNIKEDKLKKLELKFPQPTYYILVDLGDNYIYSPPY